MMKAEKLCLCHNKCPACGPWTTHVKTLLLRINFHGYILKDGEMLLPLLQTIVLTRTLILKNRKLLCGIMKRLCLWRHFIF
jgi:hypothetical protein